MSITLKSNVDGSSTLQNNGVDIINVSNTNTVSIPQNITLNNATLNGAVSAPLAAQFSSNASVATTEFVQRALGNLSGGTTISATGSLASSSVGDFINVAMPTPGGTVSLPAANSVPPGSQYTLMNQGQSYFLSRSGADTLSTDGSISTTLAIPVGGAVFAISNGSNGWLVAGSGVVGRQGDFGSSLATNGYQKLPSGLIVQWGYSSFSTSGAQATRSFTYPIAFTSQVFTVHATSVHNGTLTTNDLITWVPSLSSLSQATVRAVNATSGSTGAAYLAIGI